MTKAMTKIKINSWSSTVPILYLLILLIGCSNENEKEETGKKTVKITSPDFNYTLNDPKVYVPNAGKTYAINVGTVGAATWSASIESGSEMVAVTPTGEQNGEGTITIDVKNNPNKTERIGVVVIKNNANSHVLKISFIQMNGTPLVIPAKTQGQTKEDFNNRNSKYNIYHMVERPNVAIFWDKALGSNPKVAQRPFDPEEAANAAQVCYDFLIDNLGFANRTTSLTNRSKILIFVENLDGTSATGGGADRIGMLNVKPASLKDGYNIFYHEMCHSFEFISNWDNPLYTDGTPFLMGGNISEMTSQWALFEKYPDWMTREGYHIKMYLSQTYLAFTHPDNQYRSPYVLAYWEQKHGDKKIVSKVWKEAIPADNSDVVKAYQRLSNINQEQFNDEMFDAARCFITWDWTKENVKAICQPYANKHLCKLKRLGVAYYQIAKDHCPQNYGYNGIKLQVPSSPNSKISLLLNETISKSSFTLLNWEKREWRYGFIAMKKDGTRVYGEMGRTVLQNGTAKGTLDFTVPENTEHLWLVVIATPTLHWKYDNTKLNQWPYDFKLTGTDVVDSSVKFNIGNDQYSYITIE